MGLNGDIEWDWNICGVYDQLKMIWVWLEMDGHGVFTPSYGHFHGNMVISHGSPVLNPSEFWRGSLSPKASKAVVLRAMNRSFSPLES